MKTIVLRFLLSCSLLFSTASLNALDTLSILHLNDTHSFLSAGGRRDSALHGSLGGIARAATVLNQYRSANKNVLTLHAGDVYIGDLYFQKYFGVAEFKLMQALGFDAMTLGNHEFDLTPATLEAAFKTAFEGGQGFAVLSANMVLPKDSLPLLRSYVKDYCIRETNGIKVGIFGLTTPATNLLSLPAPAFLDTNIVPIATAMVAELRNKGCSVVICLSHLGLHNDQLLATYVDDIDLIVGGHDHFLLEKALMVQNAMSSHQTPIVQAASFYHAVGEVQLVIDEAKKVHLLSSSVVMLDASVPEEPQIKAAVDQLTAEVESTYGKVYSEVIASADNDMHEMTMHPMQVGVQDTPVGNLVSDAYRAYTGCEIAVQPGGSTAEMLYKGALVPADLFRVSGYGFNLVDGLGYRMADCRLSGADLLAGLEFGLSAIDEGDDYLLQCAGMKYSYDPKAPPFQRLRSVYINGQELVPSKVYSVGLNEFVLAFLQFINVQPQQAHIHGDTTEFAVFAAYCAGKTLHSPELGRIEAVQSTSVASERALPNFALEVWPNPADQQVEIRFDQTQSASTVLEVYDLHLRRVSVRDLGELSAGQQSVHLNCAELANGSYYLRVQSQAGTLVQMLRVQR